MVAISPIGAYLDVNAMPERLVSELENAGVNQDELREIAGGDHVIRGAELRALMARLDAAGPRAPASERALSALTSHVEENRARAEREGWSRFRGEPVLDRVASGHFAIGEGSSGEAVKRLNQALIDTGYLGAEKADASFGKTTRTALERFQRDAGLPASGQLDSETLSALAVFAPPPGQKLEQVPEFDRIYSDHRADVTIALDLDPKIGTNDTERAVLSGLRSRGFEPLSQKEISEMPDADRRRLGLTDDRLDPNAMYFVKSSGGEDAVVRLIASDPGDVNGSRGRSSLAQALRQDEVVIYSGRGTGSAALDPRVEAPSTGLRGIGSRRVDHSDFTGRPEYQLLIFSGASPEVPGRSTSDTDLLALTSQGNSATAGPRALAFLDGVLSRASVSLMLEKQATAEKEHLSNLGFDGEARRPGYASSGFLGNTSNRRVESAAGTRS